MYDQVLLHRADLLLNAGDVVRQDPHLTTDNGQCPERRLAVNSQILFTLSCSLCSHRLTVRLQRLGLIYLRDGDKKIYRSKDEVTRQGSLF